MKKLFLLLFTFTFILYSQTKPSILIRCDDLGMNHTVNMAFEEVFKAGFPMSASVMFACPWYQEAVDILKKYDHVAIGVHLTLNAEWKNYRWGPVAGRSAVPSLVDNEGFFFPSRDAFYANNPSTEEVEKELRAQIERALNTGLKIDYVDYHMGTAVEKPEHRSIVEKLAKEFNLGISRYHGEIDGGNIYSDPIEFKEDSLITILDNLDSTKLTLIVFHVGLHTPEMAALIDLNSFGLKEMSRHRESELRALLSDRVQKKLKSFNLFTYKTVK